MSKLSARAFTLLSSLFAVAGSVRGAAASPAAHFCENNERLPGRVGAASLIVVATPTKLTFKDESGTRTIKATYRVNDTLKGMATAEVTVIKTCRLARAWYDDRGYPSDYCGRDQNNAMPGFSGDQALATKRTLILAGGTGHHALIGESIHSPCPEASTADLAKTDVALAKTLAVLAQAPELDQESALPHSDPNAGKDLAVKGEDYGVTIFMSQGSNKLTSHATREIRRLVAKAKRMPRAQIELTGFADETEPGAEAVAIKRAKSVAAAMIRAGIAPDRFAYSVYLGPGLHRVGVHIVD